MVSNRIAAIAWVRLSGRKKKSAQSRSINHLIECIDHGVITTLDLGHCCFFLLSKRNRRPINFCVPEHIVCPSVGICVPIGWDKGADLESVMDKEAGHIVETAVEARAGFIDRPTTVVLIVSTTLTIAVFAAIYIGFFAR